MRKIIALFCLFTSLSANANFELRSDKEYIKTDALIKKNGVDGFVSSVVKLQNNMMVKNGGVLPINPYSAVVQLVGMPNGLIVQSIKFDTDKLIKEASKNGRDILGRDVFILRLKKSLSAGGALYNAQVMSTCTTPNFAAQFDNGIRYIFKYYDSDLKYIVAIEMNSDLCAGR